MTHVLTPSSTLVPSDAQAAYTSLLSFVRAGEGDTVPLGGLRVRVSDEQLAAVVAELGDNDDVRALFVTVHRGVESELPAPEAPEAPAPEASKTPAKKTPAKKTPARKRTTKTKPTDTPEEG